MIIQFFNKNDVILIIIVFIVCSMRMRMRIKTLYKYYVKWTDFITIITILRKMYFGDILFFCV